MSNLYRLVKFYSVEHLLFFCETDIYLWWKWDDQVLLKIYEDGDKTNKYQFALVHCNMSRVEQNKGGEEYRVVFEKDKKRGVLRLICWDARRR